MPTFTPTEPFYLSRHPIHGASPPKAVLSLTRRAQERKYLLHKTLLSPHSGQLRLLKSIHPFVPAALKQLNNLAQSGISVARWVEH